MEGTFAPSSADQYQSVSSCKQMKTTTKKSSRGFVSCRSAENMAPANNSKTNNGGLLFASPPSLYCSYPPSLSLPILNPHQQNHPPLLPLPISKPHFSSLPSRTRDLSCPTPTANTNNRKNNRPRDHSLTPKKSKQPTKRAEPKQENSKSKPIPIIASTIAPLGPDPNDLPKVVSSKVLTSSSSSVAAGNNDIIISSVVGIKDFEGFSGSVFTLSPPPSSLPLPKFSVRPKLRCNAEAAGIDAGATDNLRQLLRLR